MLQISAASAGELAEGRCVTGDVAGCARSQSKRLRADGRPFARADTKWSIAGVEHDALDWSVLVLGGALSRGIGGGSSGCRATDRSYDQLSVALPIGRWEVDSEGREFRPVAMDRDERDLVSRSEHHALER